MSRRDGNRNHYDDKRGRNTDSRSRSTEHHYQGSRSSSGSQQNFRHDDAYSRNNPGTRFGYQQNVGSTSAQISNAPWNNSSSQMPNYQYNQQRWGGYGQQQQQTSRWSSNQQQSFQPAYDSRSQTYDSRSHIAPLVPPPGTPQSLLALPTGNNKNDSHSSRSFGSSPQSCWLNINKYKTVTPTDATVDPPLGSKEAREKRLEESRDRLVASLQASKNETSSPNEKCKDTQEKLSTELLKSSTEKPLTKDLGSYNHNNTNTNKHSDRTTSVTHQQRRLSVESNSQIASSDTGKAPKPTTPSATASKRTRSTSLSAASGKKSDQPSPVRVKCPSDKQTANIKQRVIQQLLSMSQNKLREIVSNPRSRKFEFVMKYMMKESRSQQSQKDRQLAQAGILGTSVENASGDLVQLDYETLLSDPDLAVNLSNLPPEMIETLGNIFNLTSIDFNEPIDLDSFDEVKIIKDLPASSSSMTTDDNSTGFKQGPIVIDIDDNALIAEQSVNETKTDVIFKTISESTSLVVNSEVFPVQLQPFLPKLEVLESESAISKHLLTKDALSVMSNASEGQVVVQTDATASRVSSVGQSGTTQKTPVPEVENAENISLVSLSETTTSDVDPVPNLSLKMTDPFKNIDKTINTDDITDHTSSCSPTIIIRPNPDDLNITLKDTFKDTDETINTVDITDQTSCSPIIVINPDHQIKTMTDTMKDTHETINTDDVNDKTSPCSPFKPDDLIKTNEMDDNPFKPDDLIKTNEMDDNPEFGEDLLSDRPISITSRPSTEMTKMLTKTPILEQEFMETESGNERRPVRLSTIGITSDSIPMCVLHESLDLVRTIAKDSASIVDSKVNDTTNGSHLISQQSTIPKCFESDFDPVSNVNDSSDLLSNNETSVLHQRKSSSFGVKPEKEESVPQVVKIEKTTVNEVSTQTDVAQRSESNNFTTMLEQIGSSCQDSSLLPAINQLKRFLSLRELPADINIDQTSSGCRQINARRIMKISKPHSVCSIEKKSQHAKVTGIVPLSTVIEISDCTSDKIDDLIHLDALKASEIFENLDSIENIEGILQQITEIETKIETWMEIKKVLYDKMKSIISNEKSHPVSSSEDPVSPQEKIVSAPKSRQRSKKPNSIPKLAANPLKNSKRTINANKPASKNTEVTSQSVRSSRLTKRTTSKPTIDSSVVASVLDRFSKTNMEVEVKKEPFSPQMSLLKTKRNSSYGPKSKRKKNLGTQEDSRSETTSASKEKIGEQDSSYSESISPKDSPDVVRKTRQSERSESGKGKAKISQSNYESPPRKTKAELKEIVFDTSPSDDPHNCLPISIPNSISSPKTRRQARQSVSECVQDTSQEELYRPKRKLDTIVKDLLPTTSQEELDRPKRKLDTIVKDLLPTNISHLNLKSCSVVLEKCSTFSLQAAKKQKLNDEKEVILSKSVSINKDTDPKKQNRFKCVTDLSVVDSESDDNVPLLRIRLPHHINTDIPVSTLALLKDDTDQNSMSSCDTMIQDVRTEEQDTASQHSNSKTKKNKLKKSKKRTNELGEPSEHHSSKHDILSFAEHHRGAILDIKVVGRHVLAASEDGVVYSYSIKSGKLKKKYEGHTQAVTCLCIVDSESEPTFPEHLVTGSLDEQLRCYSMKTAEQVSSSLRIGLAMSIDQNWGIIYVGTKLGEVVKIDIKTFTLIDDHMKFSQEAILALKATKEGPRKVLIVGTRKQPIAVRDADTGLLLRNVSGDWHHTVYSLLLHNSLVFCGTLGGLIPVFDFTCGEEKYKFTAGVGVRCIKIYNGLLFAGCYDGFIYIFKISDQTLITKVTGSGKMILCLDICKNKIIFSCKDTFQALNFPPEVSKVLKEAKTKA